MLTNSLELFLEASEMVALGGAEVEVRELGLGHAVRRVGRADGEHGCRAVGTLCAADLADVGRSSTTSHGCWYLLVLAVATSTTAAVTDRVVAERHGRRASICMYLAFDVSDTN